MQRPCGGSKLGALSRQRRGWCDCRRGGQEQRGSRRQPKAGIPTHVYLSPELRTPILREWAEKGFVSRSQILQQTAQSNSTAPPLAAQGRAQGSGGEQACTLPASPAAPTSISWNLPRSTVGRFTCPQPIMCAAGAQSAFLCVGLPRDVAGARSSWNGMAPGPEPQGNLNMTPLTR